MPESQTEPKKKVPLSPKESALEGFSDAAYDASYEQTRKGLASGVSLDELNRSLINSLSPENRARVQQLSQEQVPVPGSQVGLFPALLEAVKGRLVSPSTLRVQPRGEKEALSLLSTLTTLQSPEQETRQKLRQEDLQSNQKLGTAVRRLSLLNRQFKEALPSGDKTPLEQRIFGSAQSIGASLGIVNNPKLLALKRNIRPMAINLIRAFGEVGSLTESEQQGAIDTINQAGLTDEERIASTRQFIEFAIVGASPQARAFISEQEDIKGILDAFNVNLDVAVESENARASDLSQMSDAELRKLAGL